MATHSSILAWRISWTETVACRATVHGGLKELVMTERTCMHAYTYILKIEMVSAVKELLNIVI